MKNILNSIIKIKNDGNHKVIRIFGIKIKQKIKDYETRLITEPKQKKDESLLRFKGLKILNQQEYNVRKDKIAIFSSVPPADSGVSVYTLKTHETKPLDYDIITDFENEEDYDYALNYSKNSVKNIIPKEIYSEASEKSNYIAKVFVMGNSHHHSYALNEAIKSKGEENRFLFLHEPLLTEMWRTYCHENCFDFANFLKQYYTKGIDDVNNMLPYYPRGVNDSYGVIPVIELTGIKNIFVHNEGAKNLLIKDLPEYLKDEVNVDVLFLPSVKMPDIKPLEFKTQNDEYIVGTFGIPAGTKSTTDIIKAIDILVKSGLKIKLLIAGYFVDGLKNVLTEEQNKYIITYDSPKEEELYKFMKSVDLAVQLRPKHHGDVSACIAELLGLETRVISTENYLPPHFEKYCRVVKSFIPPEELASVILEELENKVTIKTEELVTNYNFESLADYMKEIIFQKNNKERVLH